MATNKDIFFYRQNGLHGYMSNFSRHKFSVDSTYFNCTEQYFMYYKCLTFDPNNKVLLDKILTETNPGKIKQYGRLVRNFVPKIWEHKRYDIMLNALRRYSRMTWSSNNFLRTYTQGHKVSGLDRIIIMKSKELIETLESYDFSERQIVRLVKWNECS